MSEHKITILHANDIHGQLSFKVSKQLEYIGGVSLLSGYVKKARAEGPTFFGICGDVLQEDVLGSDYKGTNTVELINYLNPDCLSNTMRYFSMEVDEERLKLLSKSTCNDLLTWCLDRKKKIRTPDGGRFVLLNFEG